MGYIDKTSLTVTAHFTKRGREVLANALSGFIDDSYVITQFALGDDEVDYGLWEESQAAELRGRIIENMPLLESYLNQSEIMNSFIIDPPEIPNGSMISGVPSLIELTGLGDVGLGTVDGKPFRQLFSPYAYAARQVGQDRRYAPEVVALT